MKQSGIITPRWNHMSGLVGANLVIFGGINEFEWTLNDAWFYSIIESTWTELNVDYDPISYASSCSIFYTDRGYQNKYNIKLDNFPEPKWGQC